MEMAELVPKMTKLYLHRTLESVLKDVRKPDEEAARDLILKNRNAFADPGRVAAKVDFLDLDQARLLGVVVLARRDDLAIRGVEREAELPVEAVKKVAASADVDDQTLR